MEGGGIRKDLEVREDEKDLGVTFDPSLKFSKHVSVTANKANRIVGVIKRTFDHKDEEIFKPLYKTLVRPHLEYANCVWSPFLERDRTTIEKVQRRATKMIPALKDLPYETRLQRLNLPTLSYRRLRGDMIQVYKIMHGLNDIKINNLFTMKELEINLRGYSMRIHKERAHLNIRKYSFTHRVVNTWNKLPMSAVNAPTINRFKSEVDAYLSTQLDKFSYRPSR